MARGWGTPAYNKLPAIVQPPNVAGICMFVTVDTGFQGVVCSSKSSRRAAKDAKQEAAARVLVHLVAMGSAQLTQIPSELHAVAQAAIDD